MRRSRKSLALLAASILLLALTTSTAMALPRQCDEICTPSSPPWLVCAVGSIVINCGTWWFSPVQDGWTVQPMAIDQFLQEAAVAQASAGLSAETQLAEPGCLEAE